jgi:site-specific DNA recombinase
MTTQHWGIYTRVSTRHQAKDGWSLDIQREKLTAYADEQGWTYAIYEDAGISGETLEGRPGMVALLEAVDAGGVAGVLVVDESRLSRDDVSGALIRDRLRRAEARLAMPGRGELDLSDPSASFVAGILGQAAAFEQQLRTEKMKAGLRRTAAEGFWPGGPTPYGFKLVAADGTTRKELQTNEEEKKVLRLVADLLVNGNHSTYSAAKYLNAHSMTTRRGRPWRHPNLCTQLRREDLTGTWTYRPKGCDSIQINIPAIFSIEEWTQIQAAIKGRSRPQRKHRRYPLSGRGRRRLYCLCGESMYGMIRTERNRRSYYICSHASSSFGGERCRLQPQSYRARDLESAVWNEVASLLTDTARLKTLAVGYLATLDSSTRDFTLRRAIKGRLGDLKRERTAIVRKLADTGTLDALEDALAEIQDEEATLQRELDQIRHEDDLLAAQTSLPARIEALVGACQNLVLTDPDEQLMADIFDVLEVHLDLVEPYRFEGTASIPIPGDIAGDFGKGTLQRH